MKSRSHIISFLTFSLIVGHSSLSNVHAELLQACPVTDSTSAISPQVVANNVAVEEDGIVITGDTGLRVPIGSKVTTLNDIAVLTFVSGDPASSLEQLHRSMITTGKLTIGYVTSDHTAHSGAQAVDADATIDLLTKISAEISAKGGISSSLDTNSSN